MSARTAVPTPSAVSTLSSSAFGAAVDDVHRVHPLRLHRRQRRLHARPIPPCTMTVAQQRLRLAPVRI